jgi:hypothetical protein
LIIKFVFESSISVFDRLSKPFEDQKSTETVMKRSVTFKDGQERSGTFSNGQGRSVTVRDVQERSGTIRNDQERSGMLLNGQVCRTV